MPAQNKQSSGNIGYVCTGYQCSLGLGDKVAMRWLSPNAEGLKNGVKDTYYADDTY